MRHSPFFCPLLHHIKWMRRAAEGTFSKLSALKANLFSILHVRHNDRTFSVPWQRADFVSFKVALYVALEDFSGTTTSIYRVILWCCIAVDEGRFGVGDENWRYGWRSRGGEVDGP